jgi:Arc/MetJ family transcription regulator
VQAQSHRHCYLNLSRLRVGLAVVHREARVVELARQHAQAAMLAEVLAQRRYLRCLIVIHDLAAATVQRCAGVRLRRAEVLARPLCAACRSSLGWTRGRHRRRGFVSRGAEAWSARLKACLVVVSIWSVV